MRSANFALSSRQTLLVTDSFNREAQLFGLLLYSQKRQIIDIAMVVLTGIFSVEMTMKVNRSFLLNELF